MHDLSLLACLVSLTTPLPKAQCAPCVLHCKQDSITRVMEMCLLYPVVIQAWVLTCTTNQ